MFTWERAPGARGQNLDVTIEKVEFKEFSDLCRSILWKIHEPFGHFMIYVPYTLIWLGPWGSTGLEKLRVPR